MAEQWSGSTDYSTTMSFLEQHDPFPAGDGEDPDYFGTAGSDVDGSPLYDLTGWVWVVLPGRV